MDRRRIDTCHGERRAAHAWPWPQLKLRPHGVFPIALFLFSCRSVMTSHTPPQMQSIRCCHQATHRGAPSTNFQLPHRPPATNRRRGCPTDQVLATSIGWIVNIFGSFSRLQEQHGRRSRPHRSRHAQSEAAAPPVPSRDWPCRSQIVCAVLQGCLSYFLLLSH